MKKLNGKSFLIVGNESIWREILKDDLEQFGAGVDEAIDGTSALQKLNHKKYDAIISDVQMKNTDGRQLIAELRSRSQNHAPLVFLAESQEMNFEEAYTLGAAALLEKPLKTQSLVQTLQRLTSRPQERWTRRFERIRVNVPMEFAGESFSGKIKGRLLSVGQGGMYLSFVGTEVALGEVLSFRIQLTWPNLLTIEGRGVVRYQVADFPPGAGIELLDLTTELTPSVIEFLQKASPGISTPQAVS